MPLPSIGCPNASTTRPSQACDGAPIRRCPRGRRAGPREAVRMASQAPGRRENPRPHRGRLALPDAAILNDDAGADRHRPSRPGYLHEQTLHPRNPAKPGCGRVLDLLESKPSCAAAPPVTSSGRLNQLLPASLIIPHRLGIKGIAHPMSDGRGHSRYRWTRVFKWVNMNESVAKKPLSEQHLTAIRPK